MLRGVQREVQGDLWVPLILIPPRMEEVPMREERPMLEEVPMREELPMEGEEVPMEGDSHMERVPMPRDPSLEGLTPVLEAAARPSMPLAGRE